MLVEPRKTALRWKRQGAGETFSRRLLIEGCTLLVRHYFPDELDPYTFNVILFRKTQSTFCNSWSLVSNENTLGKKDTRPPWYESGH